LGYIRNLPVHNSFVLPDDQWRLRESDPSQQACKARSPPWTCAPKSRQQQVLPAEKTSA
jgi:hypothetical protein